jgi:hypothetical protein
MRNLTKSTFSAGLAMSLFGIQSMMNAFRRPRTDGPNPTVEALDAVTQAVVDRSGDTFREAFHAGDKVQRELLDMAFRFMTLGRMPSSGGASTMADATRQAAERMRSWMRGTNFAGDSCSDCDGSDTPRPNMTSSPWPAAANTTTTGWGPIPD